MAAVGDLFPHRAVGGEPFALRVTFWGALAMGASALVGHLFGATV